MSKRMVVTLVASALAVAALGTFKFSQIQTAMAAAAAFQPPPEAVTTTVAQRERWPSTLRAIGTVTAVHGVTVSADLPGIVEAISFESGRTVEAGEVLVRLDTRQERAQLAAAEADLELKRLNLERAQGLSAQGIVSQADFDRATAEHRQAEARVGEIRATIQRKQITAPFAGILGIRQVSLGQYLNSGNPVVPLQSLDPDYADFAVPQQRVPELRVGGAVQVGLEGAPGPELPGRITAVDSVVDEATRNVRVRASLANPGARLRPGMFVEAHVLLGQSAEVVGLPASAVSYAPYGDSVFVVSELQGPQGQRYQGVKQQFVKLGPALGDRVAVLSGLEPGQEVVTSGAFKLRTGAAVHVDNRVQPSGELAPRPEER
jgi:membrane fusion protein (multidrug efflux system)